MAIAMGSVVKKGTAEALLKQFQKDLGDGVGSKGVVMKEIQRLPTGIFPLDLALGGGIPRGRISMVWGNESACLSGNTIIKYSSHTTDGVRKESKGGTLENLYYRFNKIPRSGKGKYQRKESVNYEFYAPSVNEEGRIISNRITAVLKTGEKPCFRVTTALGNVIVATADHKFFTGLEYVQLAELKVGDTVVIHNGTRYKGKLETRKQRPQLSVKYHPVIAPRLIGGKYYFCTLTVARFIVEAAMNNLSFEEYRGRLNANDLIGLKCLTSDQHVHHKDENPLNNSIENLVVIDSSSHGVLHATERHNELRFTVVDDTIVDIEPVGTQTVYDVSMEYPYHNFVADNFVVHNCKTALGYLLMAQVQREGKKAIYVDFECSLDPIWAAKFGLNMQELIVISPQYAEQSVDIIEGFLYASDVGIVVVDSIAAMTTDNEIASSAEKAVVGGNSMVVGKMIRKAVVALGNASKNGNYPSLFLINQTRTKIGVMFGTPDIFPGGNALRFACSLILKVYGKDEIVKDIHPAIPTFKVITGTIAKAKMPILSKAVEYSLTMLAHGNLSVGQSPTWNFVATACKNAGAMTQAGQGKPWKLLGKEGATQKDLKALYETDSAYRQSIHQFIIDKETSKGTMGEVEEVIDPETGEILSAETLIVETE